MSIFELSFMQNAILGGITIGILFGIVGVFAVLKNQSLFADSIAHASLAGVALGVVYLGMPTMWALIVAIISAIIITYLKLETRVSFDSVIGVVYAFIFAIGIVILSSSPRYTPEITSYLFGSILLITREKIFLAILTTAIIAIFIWSNYKKIVYLTFDETSAIVRGISIKFYEYLLNIFTAIAVVVGVDLLGIVLITSLLILGPLFAKQTVSKFSHMIPTSILFNLVVIVLGLVASYYLNTPSGATIVIGGSIIYFASIAYTKIFK